MSTKIKEADPLGARGICVCVRHTTPVVWTGLFAKDVPEAHRVLMDLVAEVGKLPQNETRYWVLTNTDNGEPIAAVDMRTVAGWYFFTPSHTQERIAGALEQSLKADNSSEAWKQL
jgi:hypothetical protein